MKIASHDVSSGSMAASSTEHQVSEKLELLKGNTLTVIENGAVRTDSRVEEDSFRPDFVSLIPDQTKEADLKTSESALLPPKLQIMKEILERFFGIKIELPENEDEDSKSSESPEEVLKSSEESQDERWGIRYQYDEVEISKERVDFYAEGSVITEKGVKMEFSLELNMSRETRKELHMEFNAGNTLIDPLVINYNRQGVALSEKKFSFDLNSDGEKEKIPLLASGSGFLVLDHNGNGIIDDGSELFGPRTNDGFNELSEYDSDNNGWIDENDPVYFRLAVWTPAEAPELSSLKSLKESGVGAIFLESRSTEMGLNDGRLKKTGIYLKDNGEAGSVQEIDLKTEEES